MTKQVSPRQLELLLDFLEQHRSLALGRVRGKEGSALSKRLWSQCTDILNSDFGGAQKSAQDWKKYYNQYKSRAKAKQRHIKQGLTKTGGGPAEGVQLSPLEERLIGILGGCCSPLPARHNPLDALTFDPATAAVDYDGEGENNNEMLNINNYVPDVQVLNDVHEFVVVPEENVEVVPVHAAPDSNAAESEAGSSSRTKKRPLRENNERPVKRRRLRRSSSPKVNKEFEAAGNRLAAMEQSRIEVDRELAQGIHRHASAMENIASIIEIIAGSVNRFVDQYERNSQRADDRSEYIEHNKDKHHQQ